MGLQIGNLVPKKEISFEDLKNKKVAVDASQMLYQFLSSIRQRDGTQLMDSSGNVTSHLQGIISRITNLIGKQVKLAFVFDGKPPLLKVHEQEEREYRKKQAEKKLEEAKEQEDEELILLYGAPKIVKNLTLSTKRRLPSGIYVSVTPELIELREVLNNLGIDREQLIALSILVGTDYNVGGIKGIGPKNALRLVKEYKNFDNLFKQVKPDFDWKRIYATIKNMPVIKEYKLNWKIVDEEAVKALLVDKHEFNEERVDNFLNQLSGKKQVSKDQKGLNKWF